MQIKKCPKCGHEWYIRVPNPKSCPRCKRYFPIETEVQTPVNSEKTDNATDWWRK